MKADGQLILTNDNISAFVGLLSEKNLNLIGGIQEISWSWNEQHKEIQIPSCSMTLFGVGLNIEQEAQITWYNEDLSECLEIKTAKVKIASDPQIDIQLLV